MQTISDYKINNFEKEFDIWSLVITFYELMAQAVFDPQGAAVQVDASEFKFMLDQIIASTQAERNANPHIIEIRKRMAPLAAIKTRWVLKIAQIEHIYISPYSLKEGALFGL